ncbi:MAG: VCBS repeat-containing protein [Myxococcales bacterium]|nr:VCBS repeat-containing protein [Myxococcales bacterium]
MKDLLMRLGLVGAALVVGACTELEDIPGGVCGNGVVEAGEDCDGDSGCNPAGKAGACRFACETAGECKPGWVCGADAICRAPTGEFNPAQAIITDEQIGVVVGELNGSRPADLVSVSPSGEIVARYGGGAMLETARFKSRPILPAVGSLSADTVDDLAHGTQRALGVLLGTPQKALRPMAYSPIAVGNPEARYVITEAKRPTSAKEFLYVLDEILEFTPSKDGASTLVVDAYDPGGASIVKLPFPLSKLTPASDSGDLPVGNLDARETSPCNELVLAVEGSPEITIYSPCKAGGLAWNDDLGALPKVKLAGGAAVSLGASLVDVDGDGRLDLFVLGPGSNSVYSTFVAFGAGDGTFNSSSPAVPGAVDNTAAETGFPAGSLPLAAGDLNGDKRADLVFPNEVVWSEVPCPKLGPTCFDKTIRNVEFLQAQIADFNANGIADLAAIVAGSRNLYFLDGNHTRFPTAHEIPTDGEPTALTVGDFDGDLVLDLAIAQKEGGVLAGGGENPDQNPGKVFTVAFGNVQGPPNPPKRMGELGRIDGMAPGHLAMRGLDLMTDVGVLGLDQEKVLSVAIFNGANNRQMQSPFELSYGNENPDAPAAVMLGRFVGAGSQKDIAVLGRGEKGTRLWLAPTSGDAAISVGSTIPTNLSDLKEYVDPCAAHLVAFDQDSDQLDELFIVSPNEAPKKGSRLLVAKVAKDRWDVTKSFELEDLTIGMHFARSAGCYLNATAGLAANPGKVEPQGDELLHGEVKVANFDGTGSPDLVLMGLTATADAFESRVVVLPDGDPLSKVELVFPPGVYPFAIEPLNADGDPELELAYFALVVPEGSDEVEFALYVAEVDWPSKTVSNSLTLHSAGGNTYDDNFPLSLLSGDFNGDGVIDVAMSYQFNTDIYYGKPVLE